MGHLARDVEVKFTNSGTAIGNFCIGVTHKYKAGNGEQREEVAWVDCVAWGKTGELIGQHLKKGDPIFVNGRLKTESWEKDGQKRSKLVLVVETFQFVGGNRGGDSQARQQTQSSGRSNASTSRDVRSEGPIQPLNDDDIPF